uniref:Cytochrome c oxidase subunit 3 n=1 Tax=Ceraphronidae sp. ZJUH_2016007 TaxID=2491153 RepID=A0A3S5HLN6_9HYME|nr:cytochrome c oxidase subunit 3 [Ceraphronidae sp. ZJUH_2016007]
MVTLSPWPILLSLNMMNMFIMTSQLFQFVPLNLINFISMINVILVMFTWWKDVNMESFNLGDHPIIIQSLMKTGMILFISSEILFFVSFFWSFLHYSLSPNIEIGSIWPPLNINMINPYNVPLLNTLILLTSGITITWSHHSLINNKSPMIGMLTTIILGLYFTHWQLIEYYHSSFSFNDSSYGSIFFMATGFHGIHVLIGTIFNSIIMMRLMLNHLSMTHHIGFELSAWYWHFVDVVWLFLFILMYWWPF